jgi:hypothetical protein
MRSFSFSSRPLPIRHHRQPRDHRRALSEYACDRRPAPLIGGSKLPLALAVTRTLRATAAVAISPVVARHIVLLVTMVMFYVTCQAFLDFAFRSGIAQL